MKKCEIKKRIKEKSFFKFFQIFSNKKGFTLAEMMLVVMIIGVLFGIGTRTYYVEKERFEFNNAFIETMQAIKTARNRALTSDSHYVSEDIGSVIPRHGFGVRLQIQKNLTPGQEDFNQLTVTSFINLGDGPTRSEYQDDDDQTTYDLDDIEVETITLPEHVALRSFSFDSGMGLEEKWTDEPIASRGPSEDGLEAVIMFRPPQGQAYIGDNQGNELTALRLNFYNPAAQDDSPKKCIFIEIHKARGFPQITYGDFDQCLPQE